PALPHGPDARTLPVLRLRNAPVLRAQDRRPRRQLEPASRDRAQLVSAVLESRAGVASLDADAVGAFKGRRMNIRFKITASLLAAIRADLRRPHAFAHERVGFISAGLAAAHDDLITLAREYRPVRDEDYLPDPSV